MEGLRPLPVGRAWDPVIESVDTEQSSVERPDYKNVVELLGMEFNLRKQLDVLQEAAERLSIEIRQFEEPDPLLKTYRNRIAGLAIQNGFRLRLWMLDATEISDSLSQVNKPEDGPYGDMWKQSQIIRERLLVLVHELRNVERKGETSDSLKASQDLAEATFATSMVAIRNLGTLARKAVRQEEVVKEEGPLYDLHKEIAKIREGLAGKTESHQEASQGPVPSIDKSHAPSSGQTYHWRPGLNPDTPPATRPSPPLASMSLEPLMSDLAPSTPSTRHSFDIEPLSLPTSPILRRVLSPTEREPLLSHTSDNSAMT